MPTLLDIITEQVAGTIPSFPTNVETSAPDSDNDVSRPDETGKTLEMWMPGDPFTDDYYFGGYPVPNGGVLIPID